MAGCVDPVLRVAEKGIGRQRLQWRVLVVRHGIAGVRLAAFPI